MLPGRNGNGIVLGGAGDTGKAKGHELLDTVHKLTHDLVGICPAPVDVHTGVAALKAVHTEADTGAVDRTAVHIQADGGSSAAGTGYGEDPLFLAVQIDELPALQFPQVDDISTQHSDLLIHGDDDLQRGMGDGLVCQQRHGIGNGNAVIAAKGGTPGEDKTLIMGHIQALILHVDGAVRILLADHIHMALKDHRRMVLHAAGTLLEEDHIAGFVLNVTKSLFLRKGNQIVRNLLCITGSVGDAADLLKITKYRGRLQARQFHCCHGKHSFSYVRMYKIAHPVGKIYIKL